MRSTRLRFASALSRAFSQHPSIVLAVVVLPSLFAVAPSWAGITSITWKTPTAQNWVTINQNADLEFHTEEPQFIGTAQIEVRDANEAGLPILPLASLGFNADGVYSVEVVNGIPTPEYYHPLYLQDDDNTPDRQEIVVRLVGVTPVVQSPVLEIYLTHPSGGGGEREPARAGLPKAEGAASPTAVTLRVLRETPLGGGISFAVGLPAETRARVDVFDITGRRLRTISNGMMSSGVTTLRWDGRDDAGRPARAGIVFARLSTPREVRSARLVLGPDMH